MTERWDDVDEYLESVLLPDDPATTGALAASEAAGLPAISVSALQGRFLHLLARAVGARRILEIGTLGGYSAIWLARALPPDGRLVTLEANPHHADTARANLAAAGLADRVEVVVGPAVETLPGLTGPFDLTFVDADKPNNPAYLDHAIRLSRPGAVVVLDNVVRRGEILDGDADENAAGTRDALALLGSDPRVDATAVQTVGAKGWDGFALAVVR
jgi:predicted O-methyltransferase YrrM